MLFIAIVGINVALIAVWSVRNKQNGFAEIPKLLRGETAFIPTGIYPADGTGQQADKDSETTPKASTDNDTFTPS